MVDRVYAEGAGVPPGSLGQLFAVLDTLRATGAPADDVRYVERVSLGIHRLQALLGSVGKQSPAAVAERALLYRATVAWLRDARLMELA